MNHNRPARPDAPHLSTDQVSTGAAQVSGPACHGVTPDRAQLRQRRCPLLRAAARLGDPAVMAAVARLHPPARCPAARRERAA